MSGYRGFALCLTPLGVAFALAVALGQDWLPNRVYVARYSIDSIALVTRLGLIGSLLAFAGWGVYRWHARQVHGAGAVAREQAAAEHKRFIQRLDHEIKNPLTIMQLGVVNILDNDALDAGERASLDRMQTQISRLRQLVMDLRALTELEDRVVERGRIRLQTVLQGAMETALANRPGRGIDLTAQDVPWPVGDIIGDTDLLATAFTNLLNNALKFTGDDGRVRIHITDDGQHAIVEVADSGIGIPSAEIPRVFDELYRASNAARINGSGMGLALVQRIVQLHRGTISIRSREGHGTSITVHLPLANKS